MTLSRALSLVGLILVLVSGSVSMAGARMLARGADTLVICTGYGLVTITLDADGNPVESAPVPCPDALPAMAALTGATPPLPAPPGAVTPLRHALRAAVAPVLPAPAPRPARAPPVPV